MVIRKSVTAATVAALTVLSFAPIADAAEGGAGVYLLGKRGPLAAFVPKPGWYLTNDVFLLNADRSELTPLGDRIVGNVDAEALINIAQFTWVADMTVLGGRLAFTGVLPYGNVDVTAGSIVEGPGGVEIGREIDDSVTGFGDPALGSSLGWKKRTGDKFRAWSTYASVFIPVGDYEVGRISNVGKNRWAVDVGGAYTMANFKGGREFSSVLGFTFNGDNEDTDYSTGTEMHLELAGKQHLPSHWSMGVVGYWYEQLTGDSNNPPILGDFKGRAIAIGPEISYQFVQNPKRPVTLDLRWYHEFEVKNRLEGDSVFLTISVPLAITQKPTQDWTQTAGGSDQCVFARLHWASDWRSHRRPAQNRLARSSRIRTKALS